MITSVQLVNDRGSVKVTFKDGRISGTSIENSAVQEWIAEGNTPDAADAAPDPTWLEKRQANVAGGGYGEVTEQLEIIGEQGITAFQNHIAAVKSAIPKP